MQRISFNTGRSYTVNGQRIACEAIDGGVFMVDVDRGLEYFLPNCPLEYRAIMSAYDRNLGQYRPPSLDTNSPECAYPADTVHTVYNELVGQLSALARGEEIRLCEKCGKGLGNWRVCAACGHVHARR